MNRKEFLIALWKKGLKPLLLLVAIYFFIKFFSAVFYENGTERQIMKLVFGIGFLILLLNFMGSVFKSAASRLKAQFSESTIFWFHRIGKIMNFIAPIIFGMIIYHFWKQDWFAAAFVLGLVTIQKVIEIIREEKTTSA